jgi:hypothetical protein
MTQLVNAWPEKSFFINMITRDISLEDAILDLIDNSIDSLIRTKGIDVSAALLKLNNKDMKLSSKLSSVNLTFSAVGFKIVDQCGGIDLKSAKEDIFRFGRVAHDKESTLSVYGIGLKRAIFKIGKHIEFESRTAKEGFKIDIDVDKWEKDNDWSFEYKEVGKAKNSTEAGTAITISKLNPEILMRLKDNTFLTSLQNAIGAAYPLFLDRYVKIRLNEKVTVPIRIPIATSDQVMSAYKKYEFDDVSVTLIAGLSERIQNEWSAERAGWYVLCNGRVVVTADKTELTGWGKQYATFVGKYRGFLGIAIFVSKKPDFLPWTTTKRGLNKDSQIYQQAKVEIATISRPVLNFLNKMYPSGEPEAPDERDIAEGVKATDIQQILSGQQSNFEVKPSAVRSKKMTISVQYLAKKEDIERVKKCFKKPNWSAKEIGQYSLKYLLKNECPE